jgi:hypothetical protein
MKLTTLNNDSPLVEIQHINVIPAKIEFLSYEQLKASALELAENIQNVEVTEENVKNSKQLLAAVNRRVKEMEDKRIALKKQILAPYDEFELQVKEIVTIVKNADAFVREQIRELEEIEREAKRNEILTIFEKRIKHYSFEDTFGFDDFLTARHLNKSTTMKSIEADMVTWLEKIDADLAAMQSLKNADEVLTEYYDTKDLAVAIKIVNERNELKRNLSKLAKPKKNVGTSYVITLTNEKDLLADLLAVEMFMQFKEIQYTVEKVEK